MQHWLRLNKKVTIDATWKAFIQQFKHLSKNEVCLSIVKRTFLDDDLSKMEQNPHHFPPPTLAIERWLKRWKTKNPEGTAYSA